MKSHYIWNILISAITTLLIVQYDYPLWIWVITFLLSVFEYDKTT